MAPDESRIKDERGGIAGTARRPAAARTSNSPCIDPARVEHGPVSFVFIVGDLRHRHAPTGSKPAFMFMTARIFLFLRVRRAGIAGAAVAIAIGAVCALAGPARAQHLDAEINQRFRYDSDPEGSDFDSLTYSRINLTDLIKDRLDMRVSGWGIWDLNHNDSHDDALDQKTIRLSEFNFDIKKLGWADRVRIGRQRLYELDYARFDGATAYFHEGKPVSAFLFGGRLADWYQSAQDDFLIGGGVIWKPSWRARHQFDAYFTSQDDGTAVAAGWRWSQQWGAGIHTFSRLRTIDAQIRDWRLRASRGFESLGLHASLDYYVQPQERGDGDEAAIRYLSSYGLILGPRYPNHRIALDLTKTLGANWFASAGGSIRRRFGGGSEKDFNTLNSEQVYLNLTKTHLFFACVDGTIGVEAIHTENDDFGSLVGSVTWRPAKAWELSSGLSYSRYRFDPIDFQTHLNGQDDVDLLLTELKIPTWFIDARWRPADKPYDFRAGLIWQDADHEIGTGFGATIGVTYRIQRDFGKPAAPAAGVEDAP